MKRFEVNPSNHDLRFGLPERSPTIDTARPRGFLGPGSGHYDGCIMPPIIAVPKAMAISIMLTTNWIANAISTTITGFV